MNIIDYYTPLSEGVIPEVPGFQDFAKSWRINDRKLKEWFQSAAGSHQSALAQTYLKQVHEIVDRVEAHFEQKLPGHLVLMPSFGEFDGFARYNLGVHHVLLGIDFPDADLDYLKALTAHELSHVYRDHAPEVWSHLGKPLTQVSRREYLDAGTPHEHLVSEGLATLFSQHVYPEIHPRVHHFYENKEWEWCLKNNQAIDHEMRKCLNGDQDVWSFYSDDRVSPGSPSRTHYYWAAQRLRHLYSDDLVRLHEKPTSFFKI